MKKIRINNPLLWLWLLLTLLLTGYYYDQLTGSDKDIFSPGSATDGHYQIINDCGTCHGGGFENEKTIQKSCVSCHGSELKAVNDSHPKKKFLDPRNADRLAIIDATYCVTCHVEHQPSRTGDMGLTVPEDFCIYCHDDVAINRPSHKGMVFNTCSSAGCHNYHDNKALYEDFLLKHKNDSQHLVEMSVLKKDLGNYFTKQDEKFRKTVTIEDQDSGTTQLDAKILVQWEKSTHATSGVNCSECHMNKYVWNSQVNIERCEDCHELEVIGFKNGKHGMSLLISDTTIDVSESRLTKNNHSSHDTKNEKRLSCTSCHSDHNFNVEYAAIDACLNCHEDNHSRNFKKTKHYASWLEVKNETLGENEGVTCATCHLSRKLVSENGVQRTLVQHNQNENLEPNEKMVRSVCMNCHGLQFSLESLMDEALIESNFNGVPTIKNEGFDMAAQREIDKRNEKK